MNVRGGGGGSRNIWVCEIPNGDWRRGLFFFKERTWEIFSLYFLDGKKRRVYSSAGLSGRKRGGGGGTILEEVYSELLHISFNII